MKLYCYLAESDDAPFCRRITGTLQDGWELCSNPTLMFGGEHIICGQAVIKESDDGHSLEKPLSEY